MLILGIDPGTATTGYGVIQKNGDGLTVIAFGLIETSKFDEPGVRLSQIHGEVTRLIGVHKPDVVAMEKVFFSNNAKTAIRVGQAQGVIIFASTGQNKKVFEYAPGTIKKAVTGDGRADKKMVQEHIQRILGAKVKSEARKKTHFDNAADALAIALCHAFSLNLPDVKS